MTADVVKAMRGMHVLDRLWLLYIYDQCSALIKADGLLPPHAFDTTRSVKKLHGAVLEYVWDGMRDTSPLGWANLAISTTKSLKPLLGDGSLPVTPERRRDLAKFFEDTAWSGLGRG